MILTYFLYYDLEDDGFHQVANALLQFVPRVGEEIHCIAQDAQTQFWTVILHYKVEKVSYQLYGDIDPISKTWENEKIQAASQVTLYVLPLGEETKKMVQEIIDREYRRS